MPGEEGRFPAMGRAGSSRMGAAPLDRLGQVPKRFAQWDHQFMKAKTPLDASQQAEFDRRLSAWPAWWSSRARRVAVALGASAVLAAMAGVSLLQSDRGFTVFAFIVVGLVDLALIAKACFAPERALALSVRLQVPSDESLRRGVWHYQIDGGRVPPP